MVNALWVISFEASTGDTVNASCLMVFLPLPAGLSTACATPEVPSAIENYSEGTTFFTSTPLPEAVRIQSERWPAAAHPDPRCGRGMHCRQHSRLHMGAFQCFLLPSFSSVFMPHALQNITYIAIIPSDNRLSAMLCGQTAVPGCQDALLPLASQLQPSLAWPG